MRSEEKTLKSVQKCLEPFQAFCSWKFVSPFLETLDQDNHLWKRLVASKRFELNDSSFDRLNKGEEFIDLDKEVVYKSGKRNKKLRAKLFKMGRHDRNIYYDNKISTYMYKIVYSRWIKVSCTYVQHIVF